MQPIFRKEPVVYSGAVNNTAVVFNPTTLKNLSSQFNQDIILAIA